MRWKGCGNPRQGRRGSSGETLKAGNRERDVIVLNLFGVGRFIGLEIGFRICSCFAIRSRFSSNVARWRSSKTFRLLLDDPLLIPPCAMVVPRLTRVRGEVFQGRLLFIFRHV